MLEGVTGHHGVGRLFQAEETAGLRPGGVMVLGVAKELRGGVSRVPQGTLPGQARNFCSWSFIYPVRSLSV